MQRGREGGREERLHRSTPGRDQLNHDNTRDFVLFQYFINYIDITQVCRHFCF